ncbi:glycosyltransferase family 39 protein [Roseburia sp. AF25-25LB]|uniref:glycosyltransferase family 39 protein n=1 Tax=Roseburia sp. AF25-25LB TaxID=2293135 RepID=UPI001FA944B7|nr:glycosyltransferase family 39 protein [Roseburia sp. AF25-25LB]
MIKTAYGLINENPEFYNDEHYMIKTAYGLINEHQFALWDFVHNTTMEKYHGAMLYNLCLAMVYKITGLSVVSGRMLSVIFAILVIISLYYIGLNLLKSTETAFLASVIMLLFPGFVEQARLIRMHTLSPLAGIWLFYFGLKVIDCKNNFKKENRFTLFIKKYFDYNLKYVALFFCYW